MREAHRIEAFAWQQCNTVGAGGTAVRVLYLALGCIRFESVRQQGRAQASEIALIKAWARSSGL